MSRGKKPVVAERTKARLEEHFVEKFPLADIWSSPNSVTGDFEDWHAAQVTACARAIKGQVRSGNNPESVAAKFINTFLHQLTKYEEARSLVRFLHLPLDARVFGKLRSLKSQPLAGVKHHFKTSPYALDYSAHRDIQKALLDLLPELNERPHAEFKFKSRIQLNWLWL